LESQAFSSLSSLSESDRTLALERFQAIRLFLEDDVPLAQVARSAGISVRTAWYWVERYRKDGLAGLARKARHDKGRPHLSASLRQMIEGLALQKPCLSISTVHRKAIRAAEKLGERAPSYSTVYALVRQLEPGLLALAHGGTKAYSESFDLIHRTEAEAPNAIWQADHSELDILVKDEEGKARKPWLTIILDDYSRAIAGYMLFVTAPSAIQTALALRQAIWRKSQPGWHVCGIPQVLYTDHGCDFTSQHLEQVTADMKIRLIFSAIGRPRGRGKVERFFESLSQVFLSQLPGYARSPADRTATLTLAELAQKLEDYLIGEYLVTRHRTTGEAPQSRWEAGGFLPQMPSSLEQLDLLLLTVPKMRRVHADGLRFMGLRYIDPTLAAYVGEEVLLRYDPRDIAEIRVFHNSRFICRAICQEIAGQTVPLRDIVRARDDRRRHLRQTMEERKRTVDVLIGTKQWISSTPENSPAPSPAPSPIKLKRYSNE
jgi:putative transposase